MRPQPIDDAAIISGLLRGDAAVIEQVREWIRTTARSYRQRLPLELEDVEQDTLLDLTAALRQGKFKGLSRLQTYVRTYARHKCIDRLRAAGRRNWLNIDDLELPSRDPSPLEKLSQEQMAHLALSVFEEMPEACRELWRMLEQGMSYREMTRGLGVSEGTLRARVLRCRRRAIEVRTRLLARDRRNKNPSRTTNR